MGIVPIKKVNVGQMVFDQMQELLIRGEWKPGDRLPSEMVLCEEFEVSRNTLRAALNKLAALGFTETRKGGGTYVKVVDSDVYLNFFVQLKLLLQECEHQ